MGWLENWKKVDSTVLEVPPAMREVARTMVLVRAGHKRHQLYADILCAEVRRRARVDWRVVVAASEVASEAASDGADPAPPQGPDAGVHVVRLEVDPALEASLGLEGYSLSGAERGAGEAEITVAAARDRGLLFGVGRLLREMKMDFHISYAKPLASLCCVLWPLDIVSQPQYRMRQHQVAYRPKTNSYDGFTEAMMKQEVLDLALFGTNAIEMIPPGIDDAMQSPNFQMPWLDMMRVVSQWCDDLDLGVSIWYPAFFRSYEDEASLRGAEDHWRTVFGALARLDVLFVPGGDPGGRPADEFFRAVELQARFMRAHYFPQCQVWVSSQYGLSTSVDLGLTEPWVPLVAEQLWMEALRAKRVRAFLDGVVYGPWSCVPIDEFRAQVPADLPLRNYPDLCHVQTAQMPVFGWDLSFAVTNGRESVNPRPREMAAVIADQAPHTIGCGCYSEGVNDDINKYVWTALHWGADARGPQAGAAIEHLLDGVLSQYVCLLMDQPRNSDALVQGIYTLERNWRGDLFTSASVVESQRIFTQVQSSLAPRHRRNWRLNMLLFRANHDAFMFTRLCQERAAEAHALVQLGVDPFATAPVGSHLAPLMDASPVAATSAPDASPASSAGSPAYAAASSSASAAAAAEDGAAALRAVAGDWVGGLRGDDARLQRAAQELAVPYHEPPITMSSFNSPSTPDPLNVTLLTGAPSVTHLYGHLMALAATLYHQIGYQLSVGYGGQHRQRGAYFDLVWAPLGDVVTWNRVLACLRTLREPAGSAAPSGSGDVDERDVKLVERFVLALRERSHASSTRVLWYASFGDEAANELPGCQDPPSRPIPVHRVLPPHRPLDVGEDPMYFTRNMVEYLDASNDAVIRDLHEGRIPRCWRAFLVPIWPRTARFSMRFDLADLLQLPNLRGMSGGSAEWLRLSVRVTYAGSDINRHGGDWEELDREAQPTRLLANGVRLHGFMAPRPFTQVMELPLSAEVVRRAVEADCLILTWEPQVQHKTTFRFVPLPIAELWILQERTGQGGRELVSAKL